MSDTSPHSETAPDVITSQDVRELVAETRAMNVRLSEIAERLDAATEQIGPVLDQLSSHPLAKMIGLKR